MAQNQPKNQPEPLPEEEPKQQVTSDLAGEKRDPDKSLFGVDYYLISTVSLAVISLCALIVSIYQTNVLSGQQEVMDEQQKIMRSQQELMQQNARAQLWPRLRIGGNTGFSSGKVDELEFTISNEGTGPAIVDFVAMGYNGNYASSWYDVFYEAGILDTIPFIISNSSINNRVIQAGERVTFLSLNENPSLLERVHSDGKKDQGLELLLCYRSVFNEHWLIEGKVVDLYSTSPVPIDSCITGGMPLFLN